MVIFYGMDLRTQNTWENLSSNKNKFSLKKTTYETQKLHKKSLHFQFWISRW